MRESIQQLMQLFNNYNNIYDLNNSLIGQINKREYLNNLIQEITSLRCRCSNCDPKTCALEKEKERGIEITNSVINELPKETSKIETVIKDVDKYSSYFNTIVAAIIIILGFIGWLLAR